MAKHFATILSNGTELTFTKAQCFAANNVPNYDDAQRFFVSGEEVSAATYYAEVRSLCQAAQDKKNETHKLIRVRFGSSVGCYVWKWIPR